LRLFSFASLEDIQRNVTTVQEGLLKNKVCLFTDAAFPVQSENKYRTLKINIKAIYT
jgi:hypothetical protein